MTLYGLLYFKATKLRTSRSIRSPVSRCRLGSQTLPNEHLYTNAFNVCYIFLSFFLIDIYLTIFKPVKKNDTECLWNINSLHRKVDKPILIIFCELNVWLIDEFSRHIKTSRVILCPDVAELCSLYTHIIIFLWRWFLNGFVLCPFS